MNKDLKCSKCFSEKFVKNGFMNQKQRFKCKSCGYNFTEDDQRRIPDETKRMAIHLYLEGLGFRGIERVLNISNVIVMKWVRDLGLLVENLRSKNTLLNNKVIITTMELDEMWHYVGKKNKSCGSGWLLTEIQGRSLPGNSVVVVKRQE